MEEMTNRRLLGLPSSTCPCRFIKGLVISPALFVCIVFGSVIWLLYQVPSLLPVQPVPPPFMWHPHLSRNISAYMKLGTETALLNLKAECSPYRPLQILFIVPSAVNNSQQRETIRKTWGSWIVGGVHLKKETTELSSKMKLVFFLGKDISWESNKIPQELLSEHSKYGDIIMEDFIDSYTNLTLKSVFILKWVVEKCPSVDFIMKADDDMFINVPNLVRELKNVTPPAMLGNIICNARPIQNRWSKWYSPTYMFTGKYPNYLSGTSYVLSGDIIKRLLFTAIQTPYFHLEDVYLTGICAKKLGIRPSKLDGFSYLQRPFNPCIYDKIISAHEITPSKMMKMWNMLHNPSVLRKCKPLAKKILHPTSTDKCVWK